MHRSGNIACQSLPIVAKFWIFKQLYWLNQVTPGKVKNSIEDIQGHVSAKAKLHQRIWRDGCRRIYCFTVFYKAYKRNAFSSENPCPIALEEIEKYMQIFLPAYQFNLVMQKNDATIDDVIPAVKIIISKWSRFNYTGAYQEHLLHLKGFYVFNGILFLII